MSLTDIKECPECGGEMRSHIVFKNRRFTEERPFSEIDKPISVRILRCEKCGFSEEVKTEIDRDHALDACKYSMQNFLEYTKKLVDGAPIVGVNIVSTYIHSHVNAVLMKMYTEGCLRVDVDPDALVKTGELNKELQVALREAVEKIPRWIPTSERLPDEELRAYKEKYPKEECVEVIAVIQGSSDSTVLTYDGEYFEDFYGNAYSVSHWMPMPEAPKETESLEVQDAE